VWRAFAGARPSHERDAISMGDGNSTFSVLTLNTWVGDERRGYCSQDTERRGWIARQLREADPDVMCLQEVLELPVQTWFEETFPDYESTAQHMSTTSSVAVAVWHLIVGLPAPVSQLLYCIALCTLWLC
jgi:endonuclease/exonuclease/phosphatase family metal-dependent hydrolase